MPDFVIGRRGRAPKYVEKFRQEVPFRTDYPDFRLEVVTQRRTRRGQVRPLRERMIFDEREISAEKRAEGYRFYPEVLIDERPDLRHIHDGFSELGTPDGELVRLKVFIVRGEDPDHEGDHWVLLIRFATVGVEPPSEPDTEPEPPDPGFTPEDADEAKRLTLTPMRGVAAGELPSDAGAGWSVIGFSEAQLKFMDWLEAYRDNMELVVKASPAEPRMHADRQVEPQFFPAIAAKLGMEVTEVAIPVHPYWGGPGAYPVRVHAALSVLTVWNDHLIEAQRRAAHVEYRAIIRQMKLLYRYARHRITE